MLDWYHQGLNAFEQTCPAGHSVFAQLGDTLIDALHQLDHGNEALTDLIAATRNLHEQMKQALHEGRDQLLEYNSCRPHIARSLQQDALNQDAHSYLSEFMENIYDCYAIEYDIYRDNSFIIRPSDHMIASFPGLAENGMAITYDRDTALANEDLQFITWEHPLVATALDMVLSHEQGNSALTAIGYKHAKPGSLLVECLLVLEAASVEALQSSRYLPPTPLRLVIDEHGREHGDTLPHAFIKQAQTLVDPNTAAKVISARQSQLRDMVKHCELLAQQQAAQILQAAHDHSKRILQGEIDRLQALASINPNIRQEEIDFFQQQLAALNKLLDSAALRLDAVRVIVTT
jgi:ATP-dependent helicase HepA